MVKSMLASFKILFFTSAVIIASSAQATDEPPKVHTFKGLTTNQKLPMPNTTTLLADSFTRSLLNPHQVIVRNPTPFQTWKARNIRNVIFWGGLTLAWLLTGA